MPEPHRFEGVEYKFGSPSGRDVFDMLGSDDLKNEIVKYKMGEGKRPDAGYDHLMKERRSEDDARFIDWWLKGQEELWREGGWRGEGASEYAPTPVPTPSPLEYAIGGTLGLAGNSGKKVE